MPCALREPCAPGIEDPEPPTEGEADAHLLGRRLEDWLTCYLDDRDPHEEPVTTDRVEAWLAAGPNVRRPSSCSGDRKARRAVRYWNRLRILQVHSTTIARVLDSHLIKPEVVSELGAELRALVDAGSHRLVVDLGGVERLSSSFLASLLRLDRLCARYPGGALRVCGLDRHLDDVFRLAGLDRTLPRDPDVRTALERPWPASGGLRPLPLAVLAGLRESARRSRSEGLAMSRSRVVTSAPTRGLELALRVAEGRLQGLVIPLRGRPLLVGRDPECRLRCTSPLVSRRHAVIERRDGQIVLRDLSSTNGTRLNGAPIDGQPHPLTAGDRLEIGPLVLLVEALEERPTRLPTAAGVTEELITSWIDPEAAGSTTMPETSAVDRPETPDAAPASRVGVEVIQGVVVLTPRAAHFDAEAAEQIRGVLLAYAAEGATPCRVAVNCEFVQQITSRAVAVLLGHLLRLERSGGSLRLCRVHDRLLSILERMRLPMIVDVFPTLEEAVLHGWD